MYLISVLFSNSESLEPVDNGVVPFSSKNLFTFSDGFTMVFLNLSISFSILAFFCKNFWYLSSDISPISCPISVNLKSALSWRSNNLYSALEVIILYGSLVPFVTISSIKTPIYPWVLSKITGFFPFIFNALLIPAIKPWHAASSYPEVPFVCPAKNKPSISLYSNDNFNFEGSIESYSIA